ncbi:MAG: type 2 lanthipeptide synthetase LanM family protein, partial [Desulfocucumaceae bacterium]
MTRIKKALAEIARGSRTLYERLREGQPAAVPDHQDKASDIREMWKEFAAEKDEILFARRLNWDGINENDLNWLLGGGQPPGSESEPPWLAVLEEVLVRADTSVEEIRQSSFLKEGSRHPFEEIHSLFVHCGINRLSQRMGSAGSVLSGAALGDLQVQLLKRLIFVSQQVLFQEFSHCRDKSRTVQPVDMASVTGGAGSKPDWLRAWTGQKPSDRDYLAFVQGLLTGQLVDLLAKYPVMARLMAEVTCYWVDSTIEFIEALAGDLPEIADTFSGGKDPGQVVSVDCGLSDPHNRGRSVLQPEFASGLKLIYKPRNLGIEEAYFGFLSWLNHQAGESMFKILKTVSRGNHGWVQFCQHLPCHSLDEVRCYYRHSGMLMGALYALAGSDFHLENIIASGQYPVAVDLEVLLQPALAESGPGWQRPDVLQTMLLPFMYRKEDDGLYTIGGLGDGRPDRERVYLWKDINTDSMRLEESFEENTASTNSVYLNGEKVPATGYAAEISQGFAKIYHLFLANKKQILAEDGPLHFFDGRQVRYVLRSTQTYFDLMHNSLLPRYMGSGIEHSARIDKISRPLLKVNNRPPVWDAVKYEHLALDRLDVPLFYINTGRRDLELPPGGRIKDFFGDTPVEAAIRRIEAFGASDLSRQTDLIRASLVIQQKISASGAPPSFGKSAEEIVPASQNELLSRAGQIVREVVEGVIGLPGEAFWVQVEEEDKSCRLKFTGNDLYSGSAGILLFLAAWSSVSGERESFDSIAGPVRRSVAEMSQNVGPEGIALGAGSGLGGIIYSFVKVWKLTGDRTFLEVAERLARSITSEHIESDRGFDIISGDSGLLLGLLELYGAQKSQALLDSAIKCGNHLLKSRTPSEAGYLAWKSKSISTQKEQPLTGFSHGAAGIVHALGRLYRVAGDKRFLEGAREAMLYENSLFSAVEGNWPDLRIKASADFPDFSRSWCHGAPGICLSRLEARGIIEEDLRQKDIDSALETVIKSPLAGAGDLCCGQFGLIDILLTASLRLGRQELYAEAVKRASWFLD